MNWPFSDATSQPPAADQEPALIGLQAEVAILLFQLCGLPGQLGHTFAQFGPISGHLDHVR